MLSYSRCFLHAGNSARTSPVFRRTAFNGTFGLNNVNGRRLDLVNF